MVVVSMLASRHSLSVLISTCMHARTHTHTHTHTQNESVMQTELVSRGPLSVLMNAEFLQFYHSGVWDPFFGCDPTQTDHGR